MHFLIWRTIIFNLVYLMHAFSQSLNCKIQHVHPHHPTLEELREAALEFLQLMNAVGYGEIRSVIFGAASIRNHFAAFRSTPVRSRTHTNDTLIVKIRIALIR